MLRISALNDSASSEDDAQKIQLTKTKEAQEAEAFAAYNKALSHQQKGNTLYAEKLLKNLFDHPLLKEAAKLVELENKSQTLNLNHRGLQLLYSIHKNLASLLLQRDELKGAMAEYLKAVKIDSSEVTVWFKMGQVARKLHNYPLAKICFEEALQCNPNHWPSLDNAITVTFALGDYLMCLENISTALEKDCCYPKGLALRRQILKEQPSLESMTEELFVHCDPQIHTAVVDSAESKEFIDEAQEIRAKRRQLAREDMERELRPLVFRNPLTPFTWKNVGEQLIDLYDYATTSDPPKSLGLEVDLRDYFFLDHSVFLGESCSNTSTSTPPQKEKEESQKRLPLNLMTTVRPESIPKDDTSAFQRAKEQSGNVTSVPESLNIGDNAKESALLRRIQGHGALDAGSVPDLASSKVANEVNPGPQLPKESVPDETDLEALDVSEMPLLREEEMDMAVQGLKDMQKNLRPDLLLKANDEDLLELPDAKSLESVLSSVIEMEFRQEAEYKVKTHGITSSSDVDMEKPVMLPEKRKAPSPLDSYVSKAPKSSEESQIKGTLTLTSGSSNLETSVSSTGVSDNKPTPAQKSLSSDVAAGTAQAVSLSHSTAGQAHSEKSQTLISTAHIVSISTAEYPRGPPPPAHVSPIHTPRQITSSPPPAHSTSLYTPHTVSLQVECLASPSPTSLHAHSSAIPAHVSPSPVHIAQVHPSHQTQTSRAQTPPKAHLSPPPAHTSLTLASHHSQTSRAPTPPKAHISPPQTLLSHTALPLVPPPAHAAPISASTSSSPKTTDLSSKSPQPTRALSPSVQISRHGPTSSQAQTTQPSSAHATSPQMHISRPQTTQPPSSPYSTSPNTSHQQSSSASAASRASPQQQSPKTLSRISVLPSEHSPIATSLLSPKSGGLYPKSVSAYHSVLSSIEQGVTESSAYKTASSSLSVFPQDISSAKGTHCASRSPRAEELSQKGNLQKGSQSSVQTPDRRNMGDLIEDVVRSQLSRDAAMEKVQSSKPPESSPPSRYHSSPQQAAHLSLGSSQPANRSPHSQQGLVSPHATLSYSHGTRKSSPLLHHSSSSPSLIPMLLSETPTYLPLRYQGSTLDSFRERSGSLSLPGRHLNSLSALEAEALLQASSDPSFALAEWSRERLLGQRTGLSRTRPPSLSRSSSLPGYYTASADLSLPTYLSPPPLPPSPVSPFFPSGRESTRQPFSLHPSVSDILTPTVFPPYPLLPHPQDASSLPYSGSLYPSLFPGLLASQPSLTPTTTQSSSFLPPRSPKDLERSHTHHGSVKTSASSSSKHSLNETSPPASKTSPNLSVSDSSSSHHHYHHHHHQHLHHHSSKSPPHSSPRHEQQQQQSTRHSQTLQLQNLAKMAQQPAHSRGDSNQAASADHNYYQQGLRFQAMIESMLALSSTAIGQPSISQALPASAIGTLHDHGNMVSNGSKKKTQATSRTAGTSGAKRGPKRKIEEPGVDERASAYKRRSTRSRSTRSRKEEKSIDYQAVMKKYFPSSLLQFEEETDTDKNDESIMETDRNDEDMGSKTAAADVTRLKQLSETEEEDVKAYVRKCLKGHGVLDLISKYLLHLAEKSNVVWYEGIADIFMKLYSRLRKHITVPIIFCGDDDGYTPKGLRNYATVILTWAELSLSHTIAENAAKSFVSPSKGSQVDPALRNSLGEFHREDMVFLSSLTAREDVLGSDLGEFCVRLYWLKAKQHQLFNETLDAVDCFEIVAELLDEMEKEKNQPRNSVRIIVPNVSQDKVISLSETHQQLESLQRCRSLEDTQKLYDEGSYTQVVDNLMSTFNQKQTFSPKSMTQRERPSQLLLLTDSLYNTQRKSECMQWGEVSLHEAVLHYKRVPTLQLREDWAATLVSLFASIDKIMDEDETILKSLSQRNLVRLAHNLVSVIEISLDVADSVTEMPIGSVLPWKILYRVLKFEEMKCEKPKERQASPESSNKENKNEAEDEDEDELSPSLSMLIDAHMYLGRHSWCTKNDGVLLLFLLSVLEKEMDGKDEDNLEELKPAFEQCVYCLYGHPNKKGRARHLSDHNARPVDLTWERAGPIFHHFAPHSVPEFDSYKTSTVSPDVENLLRRILALVPPTLNPAQHLAMVSEYIDGTISTKPSTRTLSPTRRSDPYNICSTLFYLLGDFYFKNKEQTKAVKHYMLDVVLNSDRLDSWAGLALAKMFQIEQKLNSNDLKFEKPIHKNSDAALRCFRRAVELEDGSRKLWLEYGSLAYQLHSHASRQIKHRLNFPFTEEVLQIAVSRHQEMLVVARESYRRANECEGDGTEEDWLTYYMMGKVTEKQLEKPGIYLEHYRQAAICLHKEHAVYPKRIVFSTMPPRLALEPLEVYYRSHVCILKLILYSTNKADEHLQVLDKYLNIAMQSHFARGEEKQETAVDEEREEVFPSPKPASTAAAAAPSQTKSKPVYHKNPVDHEYSRHKSASDSQSEGEGDVRGQGHLRTSISESSGGEEESMKRLDNREKSGPEGDNNEPGDNTLSTEVSVTSVHLQPDRHEKADENIVETAAGNINPECGQSSEAFVMSSSSIMDGQAQMDSDKEIQTMEANDTQWQSKSSHAELTVKTGKDAGDQPQGSQSSKLVDVGHVKETSQSDSQADSSEEDIALSSAGNEGDVDTDAMEVDEEGDTSSKSVSVKESESPQISQESAEGKKISSQPVQSDQEQKQAGVEGVIEVHAGESDSLKDGYSSTQSPRTVRYISEGFVPQPDYTDADNDHSPSERLMDIDSTVKDEEKIDMDKLSGAALPDNQEFDSQTDPKDTAKDDGASENLRVDDAVVESKEFDHPSQSLGSVVSGSQECSLKSSNGEASMEYQSSDEPKEFGCSHSENEGPTQEQAGKGTDCSAREEAPNKESDGIKDELPSSSLKRDGTAQSEIDDTKDQIKKMEIDAEPSQSEDLKAEESMSGSHPGDISLKDETNVIKQEESSENEMDTENKSNIPVDNETQNAAKADQENTATAVVKLEKSSLQSDVVIEGQEVTWETHTSSDVATESSRIESTEHSDTADAVNEQDNVPKDNLIKDQGDPKAVPEAFNVPEDADVDTDNSAMPPMDGKGDQKGEGTSEDKAGKAQGESESQPREESEKWETEDKEKPYGKSDGDRQQRDCSEISLTAKEVNPTLAQPASGSIVTDVPSQEISVQPGGKNKVTSIEENNGVMSKESSFPQQEEEDPSMDPKVHRARIIDKCIKGLQLCATRFPSHYKSLYWLANCYYHTKNLDMAKDLLLGRPDWQEQDHMPAPGLFSERKQNNFFQGLWKFPIEDIDRSGCFATHVYRSVRLLLNVLTKLSDLEMLKQVHAQLRRTPDTGKKYLRDADRLVLAEEAFLKCVEVVGAEMNGSDQWPESQREENLTKVHKLWLMGRGYKPTPKHFEEATNALLHAYRIMMKGKTDVNRLTSQQAISYCQQMLSKTATPSTPTSSQSGSRLGSQSGFEKGKSNQSAPVMSIERTEGDRSNSRPPESSEQSMKSEDTAPANVSSTHHKLDTSNAKTEEIKSSLASVSSSTTTATITNVPGTTTTTVSVICTTTTTISITTNVAPATTATTTSTVPPASTTSAIKNEKDEDDDVIILSDVE